MFEWTTAAVAVKEGSLSPLSLVPELESLTDEDVLTFDTAQALALVEVVEAITGSLSALTALGIETVARRESEQVALEREDYRRRGDRRGPGPTGEALAAAALAPLLHLTPRTAGTRLDEARTLVNQLPRTFALVRAGRLDLHRGGAVASEALLVEPHRREAFDEEVTAAPARRRRVPLVDLTPGGLHRRARAVAAAVDPESAAKRAQAALDDRFVRVTPGCDPGVSSWVASLPSDTSLKAWAAVDALASQYALASPGLRIAQARADALTDLILAQATIKTTVELVVPFEPGWEAPTPSLTVATSEAALETPPEGPSEPAPASPITAVGGDGSLVEGDDLDDGDDTEGGVESWSVLERHLYLAAVDGVARAPRLLLTLPARDLPTEPDPPEPALESPSVDPSAISDLLLEEPPGDEDREDTPTSGAHPDDRHPSPCPAPPGSERTPVVLPPYRPGTVGVHHVRVGIILNSAVNAWLADPDTRIRLHGCDPRTGALTVHDPTTYRPNERLARMVRARDGHCRFPGCTTDASRTQLDHVVRFPDGPTTFRNLVCLCTRHHAFKHHSGWRLDVDPDGTCTWTTPQGRVHVTVPHVRGELSA